MKKMLIAVLLAVLLALTALGCTRNDIPGNVWPGGGPRNQNNDNILDSDIIPGDDELPEVFPDTPENGIFPDNGGPPGDNVMPGAGTQTTPERNLPNVTPAAS